MGWIHKILLHTKSATGRTLPITSKKPQTKLVKRTHEKLTVQYLKRSEHATSRGTQDEDSVLSRLRCLAIFNHDMKDELVRPFHTPDPLTGNQRTSDYWVQLPGYWIRMIHMVSPDFVPSLIQGDFGDCPMADRYTYIVGYQFANQIGTEIEDYWCSVVTTDGIEKEPEEDPCRPLYMAWQGFVEFATQPLEKERIEQDTIDTSARPAKGLKTPGEPSLAERRLRIDSFALQGLVPIVCQSQRQTWFLNQTE